MATLFAGIDWGTDHHEIVLLGSGGEQLASFQILHGVDGLEVFGRQVAKFEAEASQVVCIIETRHGLLIQALLEAGYDVRPVNPKTVDRLRRPSGAKTDRIDAFLLARHGRNELDQLVPLKPDSPIVQEMKALTRDQTKLIQEQTRVKNQLTECLREYYSLASELLSVDSPATIDLLRRYPTPLALHKAEITDVELILKQNHFPTYKAKASELIHAARQPQLRANPALESAKSRYMISLLDLLAVLMKEIKAYDEAITALFMNHSDWRIFTSIPGAGKKLAPRLLAEWGDDRDRFKSHQSVAALAGTSAVPVASGRTRYARRRYACIKPFRCALYLLAFQSLRTCTWARQYYSRKRNEGKSHSVALRSLSNQWVRIIYAMWKNHEEYNENKFLAAKREHQAA